MATQEEIRQSITDSIASALKSDSVLPWRRPWGISPNSGFPTNVVSKRRYSGVNVLLLRMAAMTHGFTSKYWATFNQWRELGGKVMRRPENVKPGHWGQTIVFFTRITKTEVDPVTGQEEETSFPLLKTYCVFNVDQVEGPFDHLRVKEELLAVNADFVDYDPAEETIKATAADIRFGGDHACYMREDRFHPLPTETSVQGRERILRHDLPRTRSLDRPRKPPEPSGQARPLRRQVVCGRGTGGRNGIVFHPRHSGCSPDR